MKKRIIITSCVLAFVLSLLLCGCGNSHAGEWKAVDVLSGGAIHVEPDVYMGKSFVIELKDDGSGSMNIGDDKSDITWTEADSGVTIEYEGKTLDLVEEDGQLLMDQNSYTIYFAKQ